MIEPRCFFVDDNIKNFIRHNRYVWGESAICDGRNGEVLFEFNAGHSSIIAFSYLANVLQRKFNAKLVVYSINNTSQQPFAIRTLRRLIRPVIPLAEKKISRRDFVAKCAA